MKKFITILISCSLALAAGAMAQQDDGQQKKKKEQQQQEKTHAPKEARPALQRHSMQPAPKTHAVPDVKKESTHAATNVREKVPVKKPANDATINATTNGNANANAQEGHHKKERNATRESAGMNKPATPIPTKAKANVQAQTPVAAQSNNPNQGAHRLKAQAKKPDIKAIKARHANFHAQPKPEKVPAVTFNQSRRIEGSDHWQGEKYAAFRSYHPQRHDRSYYHSHYNRIELIGGGYYYWNAGYWYPAWGYNPSVSYYAYDGPIYVGSNAEPPDRVIADVQASLQDQGYYEGEVDGLLGPLTRQALTGYQSDNGLYTTAAIDEPTLSSLGMD